jgi:hypothetical protein
LKSRPTVNDMAMQSKRGSVGCIILGRYFDSYSWKGFLMGSISDLLYRVPLITILYYDNMEIRTPFDMRIAGL